MRARDRYNESSCEANRFEPPSDWQIPRLDQIRILCPSPAAHGPIFEDSAGGVGLPRRRDLDDLPTAEIEGRQGCNLAGLIADTVRGNLKLPGLDAGDPAE